MVDEQVRLKDVPTTAPELEPITLADAKLHLGVTGSAVDTPLTTDLVGARRAVESRLRRQLITATWTGYLDAFPSASTIYIPLPPLQGITSINYIDTAGDNQTWSSSSYDEDTASSPGRVTLADGESWPSTRGDDNAVIIVFVAGFGTAASAVPENIVKAIMLQTELDFMDVSPKRAETMRRSVDSLLGPWRLPRSG